MMEIIRVVSALGLGWFISEIFFKDNMNETTVACLAIAAFGLGVCLTRDVWKHKCETGKFF